MTTTYRPLPGSPRSTTLASFQLLRFDLANPEELELYISMLMIDHDDGRHADKRNNYCPGCAVYIIDEVIGKIL